MYMPEPVFSVGGSYHFMDTEDKTTQEPIDKSVEKCLDGQCPLGTPLGIISSECQP